MLAMARVLRTGARLLLLDEITEGLAPVIVKKLGEVIRRLKQRGHTIVLVEQNFRFAAPLAERHYVLEHGRIVATVTNYVVPLREMLFAMQELGGLDAVLAQPANQELSPDVVEAILDEAGKFAAHVLAPINQQGGVQGCRWQDGVVSTADGFKQAYAGFCDSGWNGMLARTECGGQGLPTLLSTAVLEMWKASNMAFSLCQMLTLGAVEAITHHGSDELKRRYLPAMVEGRWTGTMNITEPQAGFDLAAIRSKAVPEDDHYRVSGSKIFITWGEHDMEENIIHLVLARLPDAPAGVKEISLFLCPKFLLNADGSLGQRNDLICTLIEHKLGIHGSATASMSFGEAVGAVGWLVGLPNQRLACMFAMMNHARLNVGRLCSTVIGGWLMTCSANAAAAQLATRASSGAQPEADLKPTSWPPSAAPPSTGRATGCRSLRCGAVLRGVVMNSASTSLALSEAQF